MQKIVTDKIIVPVEECIPGMILTQSIVDEETGNIIVAKGQVLSEENLKKLGNFKHTQVWVYIESEAQFWKIDEKVFNNYKEYGIALKSVFETKSHEGQINIEELRQVARVLVQDFDEEYKLLGCINLLPKLQRDIYYHSLNVALLSLLVGRWQHYDIRKVEDIVLSALLHDVGKLKVNKHLYNIAEQAMTIKEKLDYRRHTIYGYEMLAMDEELDIEILKGVLSHHERIDGSGYPLSLKGDRINDAAKIIGLVDVYEHLRERYHIFEIIRQFKCIMVNKFQEDILDQFCYNIANYYIDARVLLTTGEVGKVESIQPQILYKPIIRVKDQQINLSTQPEIAIERMI